ncbi:4325_t:CDS:1 [Ambispora leptoticha]|uniref:4325_t:CDS:1 n=1 Tax=Ambispora leptoticha TaxID=144679 RepID=A0A9N8YTF8_9GLOM|nr:4325_t:CDS:1 [Ambispora leptoticha]
MNLLSLQISSYLLITLLFNYAFVLQLCNAKSEELTTITTTTVCATTTTTVISTPIPPIPTKTWPFPTETLTSCTTIFPTKTTYTVTPTETTTGRRTQTKFPWSSTTASLVPNNFQELPGNPDPSEIHLITAVTKHHPPSKPTDASQNSAVREGGVRYGDKVAVLLAAVLAAVALF